MVPSSVQNQFLVLARLIIVPANHLAIKTVHHLLLIDRVKFLSCISIGSMQYGHWVAVLQAKFLLVFAYSVSMIVCFVIWYRYICICWALQHVYFLHTSISDASLLLVDGKSIND